MTAPVDVAWLKELAKKAALPDPAPCPFCWSEHVVYTRNSSSSVFVQCEECGASGPESESMSGAAREWNDILANEGALCEALECAVEALKDMVGLTVEDDRKRDSALARISALVRMKEDK